MSAPLNDPRLEAAAEVILLGSLLPNIKYARIYASKHKEQCLNALTTALRVTGADDLAAALGWFLEDPRFQVAVGGNPNVVDRMLADARAALAKYKELKQ